MMLRTEKFFHGYVILYVYMDRIKFLTHELRVSASFSFFPPTTDEAATTKKKKRRIINFVMGEKEI